MADPLSLLRKYNINRKEIIERDNQIILGEFAWNKNAKTNYLMWKSPKERSSGKEYYTLESLLFILKNQNLHHPQYVALARAANIPVVQRPIRKEVLAYLNGESAKNASIDKSVPPESPIQMTSRNCGSVGPPSPAMEVEIIDDDSQDVLARVPAPSVHGRGRAPSARGRGRAPRRSRRAHWPDRPSVGRPVDPPSSPDAGAVEHIQDDDWRDVKKTNEAGDLDCSVNKPRMELKEEPDESERVVKSTGVKQESDEAECAAKEPHTGVKQEPDEPESAAKKPHTGLKEEPDEAECPAKKPRM